MSASGRDRYIGPPEIPTSELTLGLIPADDATWHQIATFALSFNGYAYAGSFERCAAIANGPTPLDIDDVRAALFFEQRRWRHFGEEPDARARVHIRALLALLREHVSAGRNAPA